VRSDLLEVLRCPVCRSELRLKPGRVEGDEILEGTLTCTACRAVYPIADGIPDLLPPEERD
jgi:uncharacterized protein YbaR (Trm112 family)